MPETPEEANWIKTRVWDGPRTVNALLAHLTFFIDAPTEDQVREAVRDFMANTVSAKVLPAEMRAELVERGLLDE